MTKKKLLSIILAVTLVCAITVTGSYAYLSNDSNEVSNNFTAAAAGLIDKPVDPDPDDPPADNPYSFGLALLEHQVAARTDEKVDGLNVAQAPDAKYVLANDYTFLPGDAGFKDPTVYISKEKKTNIAAYLYIAVSGCDNGTSLVNANVNTENWSLLGATNDGKAVYVYVKDGSPVQITKDSITGDGLAVEVLANNQYTVAGDAEVSKDSKETITIKAYLVQAYTNDVYAALNSEFGTDLPGIPATNPNTQP